MRKQYILEKTVTKPKQVIQKRTHCSVKEIREENFEYEQLLPLYELWKRYMESMTGGEERLLKADYHGCLLHVTRADAYTQVGIRGILVRESKNTFILVTPANRTLIIPKQGSVFQFVLMGKVFTIYGDNFRASSSARSHKKFKNNVLPEFIA